MARAADVAWRCQPAWRLTKAADSCGLQCQGDSHMAATPQTLMHHSITRMSRTLLGNTPLDMVPVETIVNLPQGGRQRRVQSPAQQQVHHIRQARHKGDLVAGHLRTGTPNSAAVKQPSHENAMLQCKLLCHQVWQYGSQQTGCVSLVDTSLQRRPSRSCLVVGFPTTSAGEDALQLLATHH